MVISCASRQFLAITKNWKGPDFMLRVKHLAIPVWYMVSTPSNTTWGNTTEHRRTAVHTSREREQETDPGTNGQCVTDVGKSPFASLFPTASHWNYNRMISAHTVLEFRLGLMPNTRHMCFAVYLSELSCLYYSLYRERGFTNHIKI